MSARGGADSAAASRTGKPAVVWVPREGGTAAHEQALLASLARSGSESLVVTSDLWAMAHACVLGPGTLLVLCEPAKLRGAAQVALALRKYGPGVVVFAYEPGSAQLLRQVTDQDLVDWGAPGKPEPARPAPTRAVGKPFLRLTGDEGARPIGPSLPITEHAAGAENTADVLSADELAMLLGRNGSKGVDGAGTGGSAKGDQR
ncbi:MAG TPA: hypothetical protein VEB22_11960 [Phycisphaerales bacterium]|nr:hypothetical protein [Phycisphaerales bacterium]